MTLLITTAIIAAIAMPISAIIMARVAHEDDPGYLAACAGFVAPISIAARFILAVLAGWLLWEGANTLRAQQDLPRVPVPFLSAPESD